MVEGTFLIEMYELSDFATLSLSDPKLLGSPVSLAGTDSQYLSKNSWSEDAG